MAVTGNEGERANFMLRIEDGLAEWLATKAQKTMVSRNAFIEVVLLQFQTYIDSLPEPEREIIMDSMRVSIKQKPAN